MHTVNLHSRSISNEIVVIVVSNHPKWPPSCSTWLGALHNDGCLVEGDGLLWKLLLRVQLNIILLFTHSLWPFVCPGRDEDLNNNDDDDDDSDDCHLLTILGDPGADSGAEDENQNGREKIWRAKVRKKNASPWGHTLYAPVPNGRTNTCSWLGRKHQERVFVRPNTRSWSVWNWCVKSLSPGARIFLSYFCSSNFFPPVLIFVFGPTICPWVSEDVFWPVVNQIISLYQFYTMCPEKESVRCILNSLLTLDMH